MAFSRVKMPRNRQIPRSKAWGRSAFPFAGMGFPSIDVRGLGLVLVWAQSETGIARSRFYGKAPEDALREPMWLLDIVAGGKEDGYRFETLFFKKIENLVVLFLILEDIEESEHFHVVVS